jgi:hypothetical protein
MAIRIKIGDYLLCSDGARSDGAGSPCGPIDASGSLAPGVAGREFVGADGVRPEHAGCDAATLSFSVSRIYGTPGQAAAALFAMLAAPPAEGAVPREGALTLQDGDGASQTIMQRAALAGLIHSQVGCALALRYTFTGF